MPARASSAPRRLACVLPAAAHWSPNPLAGNPPPAPRPDSLPGPGNLLPTLNLTGKRGDGDPQGTL